MSTFYIKNSQISANQVVITGEDANHIKNVLRFEIGDELRVCDENGVCYQTKIKHFLTNEVALEILGVEESTTESSINIDLYQGLPKADKMEWIIQKGTEIGIKSFIPVITERVIVKLDEKNAVKKVDRWKKIAKEAAGQSGRQRIPMVENAIYLKNSIENLSKYDIVIVPYECEKERSLKQAFKNLHFDGKNVAIVIGPEGGFSEGDIEALRTLSNVQFVSLGPRILRTETAGIVTVAMVLYELES